MLLKLLIDRDMINRWRQRYSLPRPIIGHITAVGGVALTTGIIHAVPGADHVTNISLLYLLTVITTAYFFGSSPAVLAALLSVLSFDWFFVEPRHTLTADVPAEWLALAVFLTTAIVISQLTLRLQLRAEEARRREREASVLSQASWTILAQVSHQYTLAALLQQIVDLVHCDAAAIVVPTTGHGREVITGFEQICGSLPSFQDGTERDIIDKMMAQSTPVAPGPDVSQNVVAPRREIANGEEDRRRPLAVVATRQAPGDTLTDAMVQVSQRAHGQSPAADTMYLPLVIEQRILGILYLRGRQLEALLVEELRVLESLVNLVAVALERNRLTQAEARAEALMEADKLKTALLSMVSHDFRSPLAAIKASVTGLLQEGAPWDAATERELLSGIDQETDRLSRMVGDILTLSRLEAGAWRPQRDSISFSEIIGVALDGFSAEENRRIQVDINSVASEIWLDSVQIVQVLHNLLENALKYSPAGSGVELSITGRDGFVVIEVADRGCGLPHGEEERIFERFYRGAAWRESSHPGTGIGLAICQGLVEAHGGYITAENRTGGGAVFRVSLPSRKSHHWEERHHSCGSHHLR